MSVVPSCANEQRRATVFFKVLGKIGGEIV